MPAEKLLLTGTMPRFWSDERSRQRLDAALLKAWKNRRQLPFDPQTNTAQEETNLKWRLLQVWYYEVDFLEQYHLPIDVMDTVPPCVLALMKEQFIETHYKTFDIGFIYEHLSELLNSTEETQELIDRYDVQALDRFTQPNTVKVTNNEIHCLRCRHNRQIYKTLLDRSSERLRFFCSGCGDNMYLYWFGKMTKNWLDGYSCWNGAHKGRIRRATKAWGPFDANSPRELYFGGAFKLKNAHVELISRGGTSRQVDEIGKIDDEDNESEEDRFQQDKNSEPQEVDGLDS